MTITSELRGRVLTAKVGEVLLTWDEIDQLGATVVGNVANLLNLLGFGWVSDESGMRVTLRKG